jgi:Arc/MetJ-type ribon-helix-helix transcriptional regulator
MFVHDAVRAGLYTSEDAVIRDALDRPRQTLPKPARTPRKAAKRTKAAQKLKKPLTRAEFDQHLVAIGLISQLPDTEADSDDPDDVPIKIKGEPLSETVIRERR